MTLHHRRSCRASSAAPPGASGRSRHAHVKSCPRRGGSPSPRRSGTCLWRVEGNGRRMSRRIARERRERDHRLIGRRYGRTDGSDARARRSEGRLRGRAHRIIRRRAGCACRAGGAGRQKFRRPFGNLRRGVAENRVLVERGIGDRAPKGRLRDPAHGRLVASSGQYCLLRRPNGIPARSAGLL